MEKHTCDSLSPRKICCLVEGPDICDMISGNERVPFVMLDFVPQQRLKKFSVYTPGIMVPNLIHSFTVGQIGGSISFSPHPNLAASSAAHFTFTLPEEEGGIMGKAATPTVDLLQLQCSDCQMA